MHELIHNSLQIKRGVELSRIHTHAGPFRVVYNSYLCVLVHVFDTNIQTKNYQKLFEYMLLVPAINNFIGHVDKR